jgi:hypothetical protein
MRRTALLVLILLALMSTVAAAQTRRGTSKATAAKTAAARHAAAERIVDEITIVSTFLLVYGSIAKGIQASEEAARGETLPPATQALLQKNKTGVVESIRNLQDGLRRMEMDFAEDPSLKSYYQQINKLSEDVGFAADAAEAGRYDDAGKRLVAVVGALARALVPETN